MGRRKMKMKKKMKKKKRDAKLKSQYSFRYFSLTFFFDKSLFPKLNRKHGKNRAEEMLVGRLGFRALSNKVVTCGAMWSMQEACRAAGGSSSADDVLLGRPRGMTQLAYNRMRPAPQVDGTALGQWKGKMPEQPVFEGYPDVERRVRAALQKALPRARFEEAEPGVFVLPVQERELYGKKHAKALRKDNRVPAILFGGQETPELLSVRTGDLLSLLAGRGLMGHDYVLALPHDRRVKVTPHICQLHPTSDVPMAITFHRWSPPVAAPPVLSTNAMHASAYRACRHAHRSEAIPEPRRPGTHKQPLGPTKAVRARRDHKRGVIVQLRS